MAGITTSGTIIRCEDNTHADAGGDGEYSLADISAKLPTIFHDLNPGAPHRMYGSDYTLQNGDGGSAPTTIRDSDCTVEFASGKTYQVSTASVAAKRTEFGQLVEGSSGKPTGILGVNMVMRAQSAFRGQLALYGSKFVQETGNLIMTPLSAGLDAELVNCLIDSVGAVTLGAAGVNSLRRIYNVDIGLSGLSARVGNMVADSVERIVMGGNGIPDIFSTAAAFQARDIVWAGTPTSSDLRYTGASEIDLAEPIWSGNAEQVSIANNYINEWWRFLPYGFDLVTGAPVEGVSVQLYDKFGSLLVDAVTDSLGQITFSSGFFMDLVKARRLLTVAGVLTDEPLGPFTLIVNRGATVHSGYLGYSYKFNWPYTNLPSGYGRQLRPVGDGLPLVPKYGGGAGREEYRGGFA